MARDYSAFLRQTPWYAYPFTREAGKLWDAPIDGFVRGWERRLGIGFEFLAKAAYGKVLGGAVAATGAAQLVIRSVVSGVDESVLAKMDNVKVVGRRKDGI